MSRRCGTFKLQTAATVSAATQTGTVPTENFQEANVFINVTAAGTTMTVNFQVSPDDGTTWVTHSSTAAITATGTTLLKVSSNIGKLARLDYSAVTGSFTVNSWVECKQTGV